jgi:hypothetical protein
MTIEEELCILYPHLENRFDRIEAHDEKLIVEYLKSKERLENEQDADFWYRKYRAIKNLALFYYSVGCRSSAEFWLDKLERMGGSVCPYCRMPLSLIEILCNNCFNERQGSS